VKKSISIWAFPSEWSLERCAALAQEAGFQGMELAYALQGPLSPEGSARDAEQARATLARFGLQVASMATGVLWQYNLLSPIPEERAAAKVHIRTMLRVARDLGTDAILVVPGFVGPFEAGAPVVTDYEATYAGALADLRELARDAEQMRVHIGIENVWNRFLTSALEMRQFVDAVGSPYVGVYMDVGNILRTGYPQHWIRILGQRIRRVHFKDFRIAVGTLQGFVDLLEGDVDFPAVMAALRDMGYDGWVTAELFARPQFPEALVYRASRDMDTILQGGAA
jgi:L-ribulose-5-phosphate 3-epimerase